MLRYMLDTVTCVHTLRADELSGLAGRFNRHAAQICISSIALAELRYGAENSKRVSENHDEIDELVARLTVLDFDAEAAADYGRLRVELRRSPIGSLDALIAAHARSRDLIVVTANVSEFSRVPALRIEDWGL